MCLTLVKLCFGDCQPSWIQNGCHHHTMFTANLINIGQVVLYKSQLDYLLNKEEKWGRERTNARNMATPNFVVVGSHTSALTDDPLVAFSKNAAESKHSPVFWIDSRRRDDSLEDDIIQCLTGTPGALYWHIKIICWPRAFVSQFNLCFFQRVGIRIKPGTTRKCNSIHSGLFNM